MFAIIVCPICLGAELCLQQIFAFSLQKFAKLYLVCLCLKLFLEIVFGQDLCLGQLRAFWMCFVFQKDVEKGDAALKKALDAENERDILNL